MAQQRIHKKKTKKSQRGSDSVDAPIASRSGSRQILSQSSSALSAIDLVLNQNRRY